MRRPQHGEDFVDERLQVFPLVEDRGDDRDVDRACACAHATLDFAFRRLGLKGHNERHLSKRRRNAASAEVYEPGAIIPFHLRNAASSARASRRKKSLCAIPPGRRRIAAARSTTASPPVGPQEDILTATEVVVHDTAGVDRVQDRSKFGDVTRPLLGSERCEGELLPVDLFNRERQRVDPANEGGNSGNTLEPTIGRHFAPHLEPSEPADKTTSPREILHDDRPALDTDREDVRLRSDPGNEDFAGARTDLVTAWAAWYVGRP